MSDQPERNKGGWQVPTDDRRCTAHTSSGLPCRAWAIRGAEVCVRHGGQLPAVRRAAARRLLREKLSGEVGEVLDLLDLEAEDVAPLDALQRAVARADAICELWYAKCGELGLTVDRGTGAVVGADHLGDDRAAAALVELRKALDTSARLSKLAIDAGLDERRVRLAEGQAALVSCVVQGALLTVVDQVAGQLDQQTAVTVRRAIAVALQPALAAEIEAARNLDEGVLEARVLDREARWRQLNTGRTDA